MNTVEELTAVLRIIHSAVLPGEHLAGLTMNHEQGLPDQPQEMLHKWGAVVYGRGQVKNGDLIQVDISLGGDSLGHIHLETIFWDRATYEKAFFDAGFSSIQWRAVAPYPHTTPKEMAELEQWFSSPKAVAFLAMA